MKQETKEFNKEKVLKYLQDLNQYELIKIDGTEEERLIFKKRDEVFKIFGEEKKGVLNPFNDYSYNWLNSFLSCVIDLINSNDFDTFEELNESIQDNISEWADSETSVYTYDLTKWLHDNNNNVEYLEEAIKEFPESDNHLGIAQYKQIEELFNNALSVLIDNLKSEFEE